MLLLELPDAIRTEMLMFAGVLAGLQLSLTQRTAFSEIWDAPSLWAALLHEVHDHATWWTIPSARALRDEYRHRCFGLPRLLSWRSQLPVAGAAAAITLAAARRAVRGLRPSDDVFCEAVANAVIDILRWYDVNDDEAREEAGGLAKAVAQRPAVFGMALVQDVQEAYHESLELHRVLLDDLQIRLGTSPRIGGDSGQDASAVMVGTQTGSTSCSLSEAARTERDEADDVAVRGVLQSLKTMTVQPSNKAAGPLRHKNNAERRCDLM